MVIYLNVQILWNLWCTTNELSELKYILIDQILLNKMNKEEL